MNHMAIKHATRVFIHELARAGVNVTDNTVMLEAAILGYLRRIRTATRREIVEAVYVGSN